MLKNSRQECYGKYSRISFALWNNYNTIGRTIADNFMYNYIIIIPLKFTQIVDSMVYEQKVKYSFSSISFYA